jgi:hypothetical protein
VLGELRLDEDQTLAIGRRNMEGYIRGRLPTPSAAPGILSKERLRLEVVVGVLVLQLHRFARLNLNPNGFSEKAAE